MAQVLVRNLDDSVVASLKQRAFAKGVSLEQELREVLTVASRPDRKELLAELARCRALTPAKHRTLAEEVIRAVREES
ncbi:MAG: hypothetical protein KIT00_10010 [Rhodospirillales bacterium]|nr:hypothetical protein [Rhodospirillales bacterium]